MKHSTRRNPALAKVDAEFERQRVLMLKQQYIEELKMQLQFVSDVYEFEELMETITYLEESREV